MTEWMVESSVALTVGVKVDPMVAELAATKVVWLDGPMVVWMAREKAEMLVVQTAESWAASLVQTKVVRTAARLGTVLE